MRRWIVLALVAAISMPAEAIVAVPGNIQLYGDQKLLKPLIPQFRRCGAMKIVFRNYGINSQLFVDQDPRSKKIFSCAKRVARNLRWQVQVQIDIYGRYEI